MTAESTSARPVGSNWRTPAMVIVAGCLIALIGFGIRSVFGLFLEPITEARGWGRETYAIALAIQNLLWGIGVPIAGAIADKFGPVKVIGIGAIVYAFGVWGVSGVMTPMALHMFAGVLTGLGVAFTAFSLALAAMAKVVGPERRTLALGVGTASGSLGQVLFSPITQGFIGAYGWESTLLILASTALVLVPLAFVLPSSTEVKGEAPSNQTLGNALSEAVGHSGYLLLTVGFFVCGFHVAFITVHFPAYVKDLGLGGHVGAYGLAIVGLFNIVGSFSSGIIGQRFSKKDGLSVIYTLRAVVITALMVAPKTELTIYLFAVCMGLLWLSTVPLTTSIVAQVFGVRYMATLFGIVFFSHQLGSFVGVWLGGLFFDLYGSYDYMWWAGVFFGLLAAIIHMPIDERPVSRLQKRSA